MYRYFFARRSPRQVFAVSEWRRVYSLLLLCTDTRTRSTYVNGEKGQRLGCKINKIYVLDGPPTGATHRIPFSSLRTGFRLHAHENGSIYSTRIWRPSETIHNRRFSRPMAARSVNVFAERPKKNVRSMPCLWAVDNGWQHVRCCRLNDPSPKGITRILYDTLRTV